MTAAEILTADLTTSPSAALRIATPSSDVVSVPFNRSRGSTLNPRKHFAHAPLVELAVNIFERTQRDAEGHITASGIEQNLIGRMDAEGVEIAAGERRYRAVALLVDGLTVPVQVDVDENGRPVMGERFLQVPDDYPMPFKLREMTDVELIETATVENVMREDMEPMEEADAYLALYGAGRSIKYIAEKYHKHPATVEAYIQLASGLGKEGRKLLRNGEINLEHAKVIASATGQLKKSLIDHARSGSSATTLKHLLRAVSFPVSNAIFDVKASGLHIEGGDGLGLLGDIPARFKDPKAALSRQLEELEKQKAEAEQSGQWGHVEVLAVDSEYANLPTTDFVSCPDGMKQHLTLICATKTGKTGRSEIYVRRAAAQEFKRKVTEELKQEAAQQTGAQGGKADDTSSANATTTTAPASPVTAAPPKIREAAHTIAHQTRAQAIQGKLATDPHTCLALSCHALIESYPRHMEITSNAVKGVPLTPEARALVQDLLPVFCGFLGLDDDGRLVKRSRMGFNVLNELLDPKVSADDLLKLWALLTHQQVGSWDNNQGGIPHRVQEMAEKLKVKGDVQQRFTLTKEYLDAYTTEGLHTLIETMPEQCRPVGIFKASKGDLVGLIVEKAEALKKAGWLPELVKFK